MDDLAKSLEGVRREVDDARRRVDTLRTEIDHSDATALPIVVVGVALSGLSTEVASLAPQAGMSVLFVVGVWAGYRSWSIWRSLDQR